tara:strand:- start:730 stop:5208 length:4479 start_codon:yes stop_codon:yes gene_type:complete
MGRPSQEYVDNSIKRLEEDRQKGTTAQVMESVKPIAADVWNIGFEAMPERMYSTVTGVIPESVPYIGGGGERAIETRRILDERSKQGKQIVEQFGATSPENLQFIYDTEKILEKRFEERPWWQEIGTSFFNPLDWLLGAGIGKGVGAGIRGVKALRGTSLAKGALKPPIREPNVDFMPSWYRNIPETDLRKITDDIPTPPITQPTTQALAVIPPIAKVARPLQQGVMDIADPTLYPIPLPAQTPSTQLQQAAEGLGREMGEALGIRPTQQQLLPGQRAIDIAEQQRLPLDLTYKGEAWTPPARPGQIIEKAPDMLPDIPIKARPRQSSMKYRPAGVEGERWINPEDILGQSDQGTFDNIRSLLRSPEKLNRIYMLPDKLAALMLTRNTKRFFTEAEQLDMFDSFAKNMDEAESNMFSASVGRFETAREAEWAEAARFNVQAFETPFFKGRPVKGYINGKIVPSAKESPELLQAGENMVISMHGGSSKMFEKLTRTGAAEGLEEISWKNRLKGVVTDVHGPKWFRFVPVLTKFAAPEYKRGVSWAESLDIDDVYEVLLEPFTKAVNATKPSFEARALALGEQRSKAAGIMMGRLGTLFAKDNITIESLTKGSHSALVGKLGGHELEKPLREVLKNPEEVERMAVEVFRKAAIVMSNNKAYKGAFNELDDMAIQSLRSGKFNSIDEWNHAVAELDRVQAKFINEGQTLRSSGLEGPYALHDAMKAFHSMFNLGHIPNEYAIHQLATLFGPNVGKALLAKRANTIANRLSRIPGMSTLAPVGRVLGLKGLGNSTPQELMWNLISLPKSLRASFDLSFAFRQGMVLIPHQPGAWKSSFNIMLKTALPGGERVALVVDNSIKNNELYAVSQRAGLDLTDVTGMLNITSREDEFQSALVRGIPYIRASERAYVTMGNKLRFDTFQYMLKDYEMVMRNAGKDLSTFRTDPEYWDALGRFANFINDATGRGKLPRAMTDPYGSHYAKTAYSVMNAFLWSPRFLTSRIMLPYSAMMASRKMGNSTARAAISGVSTGLVSWVGMGVTLMLFFKYFIPGADAGVNPNAGDFGKVKIGNTTFDIWAGYAPLAKAVAQTASGERETTTGNTMDVDRLDVLGRFAVSKFSPAGQAVKKYAITGEGFFGEDANIWEDMKKPAYTQSSLWYQMVVPMMIETIHDAYDEYATPMVPAEMAGRLGIEPSERRASWDAYLRMAGAGIAETFGIGTSTYLTKEDIAKEITSAWESPLGYEELPQMGKEPGIVTQQTVKQIARERETARGIERTSGLTGELAELNRNEQDSINNIGTIDLTIGGQTMSVNEWIQSYQMQDVEGVPSAVRSKVGDLFFSIRSDFFSRKDQAMYGEEWKDITEKELQQMDFKNRKLAEWRKIRSGARGADEYNKMLDSFEKSLQRSAHPEAPMALAWIRMNAYDIDIPENILPHLPYITQIKYDMARKLRRSGSPFIEGFGTEERRVPESVRRERQAQEQQERQKKPLLQELYKG